MIPSSARRAPSPCSSHSFIPSLGIRTHLAPSLLRVSPPAAAMGRRRLACHSWLLPLVLVLSAAASSSPRPGARDAMFIVMMIGRNTSATNYVLQDMYCLDPVLPSRDAACRYRVLAPVDSYFSDSRIRSMSVDFEHPSEGTDCSIEWGGDGNEVNLTCQGGRNRFSELPAFRSVDSTSGTVAAVNLIVSESRCLSRVHRKEYYKFGLNNFPERRPTVVFYFETTECRAGAVFGRPDFYRTTEAPCRYNARRRCRPLTKKQEENANRAVLLEGSEL